MTFKVRPYFEEYEDYIHMAFIAKQLQKSVAMYDELYEKIRQLPGVDKSDVRKLPDLYVPLTEALDHALHLTHMFEVDDQFKDLIAERRQKWIDEEPERQALIDDGTFIPQVRRSHDRPN